MYRSQSLAQQVQALPNVVYRTPAHASVHEIPNQIQFKTYIKGTINRKRQPVCVKSRAQVLRSSNNGPKSSNRSQSRGFITCVLIMASLAGMCYQLWDFSAIYFAYDVVIEIDFLVPTIVSIPALTICFPYTELIQDDHVQKYYSHMK